MAEAVKTTSKTEDYKDDGNAVIHPLRTTTELTSDQKTVKFKSLEEARNYAKSLTSYLLGDAGTGTTWTGDSGLDTGLGPNISYTETVTFTPMPNTQNVGKTDPTKNYQLLTGVSYHSKFFAKEAVGPIQQGQQIHDEVGYYYYCWDFTNGEPGDIYAMKGVTTARGVMVLAGGTVSQLLLRGVPSTTIVSVQATKGDSTYGIVQPPFVLNNAPVSKFQFVAFIDREVDSFYYKEVTTFTYNGQTVNHTDSNTLTKQA